MRVCVVVGVAGVGVGWVRVVCVGVGWGGVVVVGVRVWVRGGLGWVVGGGVG